MKVETMLKWSGYLIGESSYTAVRDVWNLFATDERLEIKPGDVAAKHLQPGVYTFGQAMESIGCIEISKKPY